MLSLRVCRLLALLLPVVLIAHRVRAEEPPRPDAEAAGLVPAKLARIEAFLQDAVDHKLIGGGVALVARHGKLGYLKAAGWRDVENKKPMATDTLFRIASMTKPVTSVAVMMLVEDGKVRLNDPVSKFLPEFKEPKVLVPGKGDDYSLKPAEREITIHDLLTHTSGLTYRLWLRKPLGALYREAGVSDGLRHPPGTLADNIRRLAKQPLLFQPGSAWEYGLSTDVLGRVVEVVSDKTLDAFFAERIFRPLKMADTFFYVPAAKKERLASLYLVNSAGKRIRVGAELVKLGDLEFTATYPCEKDGKYFSGGAGLVSTARDYARFCQMLLNGGELDGARLLKAETIKQMTSNQIGALKIYIPDHGDRIGYGFGVLTEAGKSRDPASVGTYSWGGIFYTYFWVDPHKDLIGVLMTQIYALDAMTQRGDFKKLVYDSLKNE